MKKDIPIHFASAPTRAGKDVDFAPLHRQEDGPREPAARLYADKRTPQLFEKDL